MTRARARPRPDLDAFRGGGLHDVETFMGCSGARWALSPGEEVRIGDSGPRLIVANVDGDHHRPVVGERIVNRLPAISRIPALKNLSELDDQRRSWCTVSWLSQGKAARDSPELFGAPHELISGRRRVAGCVAGASRARRPVHRRQRTKRRGIWTGRDWAESPS